MLSARRRENAVTLSKFNRRSGKSLVPRIEGRVDLKGWPL